MKIYSLPRGMYFSKKEYSPFDLKPFEKTKERLPNPILSNNKKIIDCYWYAVRLAFKNVKRPTRESGFVSDFVDAALMKIYLCGIPPL